MLKSYVLHLSKQTPDEKWNSFQATFISTDESTCLFPVISKERKTKVLSYRFPDDQKMCLYAELLALYTLQDLTNFPVSKLKLVHPHFQKPYVKDMINIDFIISHSGGCIFCVASDVSSIGVDVEKIKKAPYEIMSMIFHPEEILYVTGFNCLSPSHHGHFFTKIEGNFCYSIYLKDLHSSPSFPDDCTLSCIDEMFLDSLYLH